MTERLFLAGKLTDLNDPRQLGRLNDLLYQLLAAYNSFDPNSFALAWIESSTAGQVIASRGVGNPPEWDSTPTLTGATFTGLTASYLVSLTAGKALTTTNPATFAQASEKNAANGYAGLNAASRVTKGSDVTDDLIVDLATKGVVLKDTAVPAHYWRIGVSAAGALTTTDLGTSKP